MKKYIIIDNNDYFPDDGDVPIMSIYDSLKELFQNTFDKDEVDNFLKTNTIEDLLNHYKKFFTNGDGQSSISIWKIDIDTNISELLFI